MMEEKELIGKLRELGQIRPKRDWVVLTKNQILAVDFAKGQPTSSFFPFFRLVYLSLLIGAFILLGFFGFAQRSLPGDHLYLIKKIMEKTQAVFVSEADKPQASLELANRRLEELTKIAQTNQVQKLAPAINEFQASLSEATKNLSRIEATSSEPVVVKRFVDQAKNIEKKAKEVKSLGVVIGEEELSELAEVSNKLELELLVSVLKNMISDLEKRTLTEKQEEILSQTRELVSQGKYSEALELLLINMAEKPGAKEYLNKSSD